MGPGGTLPDTGVIVIICGAQLPTWSLPHKHLQQRVALGVARRVVAPTGPGCSLSRLPVLLLCACCWGLDSGENCHPVSSRELFPGWGLCWGEATYGYGLSKHLVSKGVGMS